MCAPKWLTLIVLLGSAAMADESADRSKLVGSWQLTSDGSSAPKTVWKFEENGDSLRVVRSDKGEVVSQFECNTMGRECEVQGSGKKAKVSMWFSGTKLVELETRGSDVIKRRFEVTGNGEALQVEVIPVVPAGKTEVLHFNRVPAETAKQ